MEDRSIWSCAETEQDGKQQRDDLIPLEGNNRFDDDDDDFNAAVVGEGNGNNFVRQYGFGKKNDVKT